MKKINTYQITFILILAISVPVFFSGDLPDFNNATDFYLETSAGPIDFVISSHTASYNDCNDSILLSATINSPSDTWPEQVLACVNGTNYTLAPRQYTATGLPNPVNITDGVEYLGYVVHPELGEHQIKYYALNDTSASVASTINDTLIVGAPVHDGSTTGLIHENLYGNTFLFTVKTAVENCPAVEATAVTLTVGGQNYTMEDPYYDIPSNTWIYRKTLDYPKSDDSTYIYNATIYNGTEYIVSGSSSITCSSTRETSIAADIKDTEYRDNDVVITLSFIVNDSLDKAPDGVELWIAGTSTVKKDVPLDFHPDYLAYQYTPHAESVGAHWNNARLDDYEVALDYGVAYTLTPWIDNGSLIKGNEINVEYDPFPDAPFSIEVLNSKIYTDSYLGTDFKMWNITVNVSSSISNFDVQSDWAGNYISTTYEAPAMGDQFNNGKLYEDDLLDLNYIDGKIFEGKIPILSQGIPLIPATESWWGKIGYYLSVEFTSDDGDGIRKFPETGYFTSAGVDGSEGSYPVKKGSVHYRDLSLTVPTCCGGNINVSEAVYFQIVDKGRHLGSDYVDLRFDIKRSDSITPDAWYGYPQYQIWDDYVLGRAFNRFNHQYQRFYINPDDPRTYPQITVDARSFIILIPVSHINEFDAYLNEDAAGTRYMKQGSKNSWAASVTMGDGTAYYEYTFNSDGILTGYTIDMIIGDYRSGIVLKLDSVPWWIYVAIGGAIVALASISFLIVRARRNKKYNTPLSHSPVDLS